MSAQYNPKTLTKTIWYITYHAPAEYGLFWDPDGTMPWKELYWVLQEDPSLRFVRESIIKELIYLGLDLPFTLDGNLLRLRPGLDQPFYPVAENVPERLYFACRRKEYPSILDHGLARANRSYVPVIADKELALRLAKRRDPEPVLVEVLAASAHAEGESIYYAGGPLYLVEALPVRHLIFPLLRADRKASLTSRKKAETKPSAKGAPISPGSFFVGTEQFLGSSPSTGGADKAINKKGGKKPGWKRDAKKERHKRTP